MGNGDIMQLIYLTSGSLGTLIGIVFWMTIKKVDKQDFETHCIKQEKINDKFNDTIKNNNDLLIRVDQKLRDLK